MRSRGNEKTQRWKDAALMSQDLQQARVTEQKEKKNKQQGDRLLIEKS